MKRTALMGLLVFANYYATSQSPDLVGELPTGPTMQKLRCIRMISIDNRKATSFIANYRARAYLVTARHVLSTDVVSGDSITVFITYKETHQRVRGRVFFASNPEIDIAVIPLSGSARGCFELNERTDLKLGQDCMILGFPLGLRTKGNGEYIPFLKKASFSGIIDNDAGGYIFDASGNRGFSGGPVITRDSTKAFQSVVAVISSGYYEPAEGQVRSNDGAQSQTVQFNTYSGLMLAYDAVNVIRIIIESRL